MRIDGPQLTSSLSLNGTTITDLNVFVTTASFNGLTGSTATTGSNLFKGTQTISGSILPAVNNTYDLGSPTYQFRHVYISTGSLYIDGTKVLGSTAQELQITTDVGQSFKILETGSDSITLQSVDGNITLTNSGGGDVVLDPNTGVIQLKGPTTIYAGYKFLSSDGNAIHFGNGIAVTGSIVSTVTPLVSGSSQISYTGLSNVPSGIVSGSSQISYVGITNIPSGIVSSSSQIIYSGLTGIPSGIVSGSSQLTSSYDSRYVLSGSITQTTWDNIANKPVGIASGSSQIDITGTTGYSTFSSSISNSISSLSSSIATTTVGTKNRVDSIEAKTGSYATTGSNAFQGTQTITGSLVITQNLTVLGSSSITYVTSSQLRVDDNIITLNTAGLAQRFGGIEIYDSGSASTTASLLWDSLNNKFLYQHPAGADTYASAWLMSGPVNNGALGSEVGLTTNKIVKATDDDHIGDSIMTETGGGIGISGSLSVTGSIVSTTTALVSGSNQIVYSGLTGIPSGIVSGSSQVIYSGLTGIPSGIISGSAQLPSGLVSGSSQILIGSGIWSGSAQLPSGIVSSSAQTIANLPSGVVSGSSQILNGSNIWSGSAQLPSGIVSGSVQIVNLGFATTSSVITASSVRNVDTFTASANQSTFTSSQGYSVGLIDVYVNGSKLAASDYVALNGTSVLLNVAAEGGETVELYAYFQALNSNNALRTVTTATATASQTVFTGITYTQGLIEVYYNGSRLSASEYTATNGTSVTLSTAANVNDILDFIAYNYTVGAFVGLSGTGTANYLPKYASTSSLTNSSIIDNSGAVTINGTLVVTGTTLVSGSSQILNGTTIHSGSFFNGISVVSGSGQISYAGITNIPSGIVSGSAQIPSLLPSGVVSGSAQTIAHLPSGTVSGSVQVDVMSTTNIARLATTGSNTFQGSQTINGSLVVTGSLTAQQFIVSSSVTYLTESFASGSHKFGDSSDDTHQFTGSVLISGSILATGTSLVSGSSQVDVMSTTNIARLATTGSNVFTGAITGTTATLSGAITSKDVYITNSANADVLEIFQSPSVLNSFIDYPSGRSLILRNKGTAGGLTLASTGAATFSSSVNVIGVLTVGNAVAATNIEFNLSGVSGKAKRIQFQDGVTGQWLLGQGAASETSAFELYNATGTIVLSVNKTTNISTFNGSTTFAAKTNGNNISLSSNGTAMEMYNTSGTVKNWQISSQVVNSQCMDFTPSTANGGTTYSTPILTIDGEQNRVGVGTGTSRPLTLFHTYSATDNLSTFQAGSASYGVQLRFRHGSTLTGFINSNTTNIFSVYNTNSTELLSVTPGGDVFHYGGTSNQGLWTYVQVGSCTGQNTFNFDVTVGDEGGGGNIFKVEAGFAHYSSMSYNCLAEFYISCRGAGYATTDVVRVDTAYGGSFTATKSDAATLRVTKNAGSYPGGGRYWIRVTKVTY